jgi:RND family efflux transporter MFP subunit
MTEQRKQTPTDDRHTSDRQANENAVGNAPGNAPEASHADKGVERHKSLSGAKALLILVVALVLAGVLVVVGIIPRVHADHRLTKQTDAEAAPTVTLAKPTQGKTEDAVTLPGALQAYISSPIYARTSGYLGHWYFDIGAHVRKGQLLATIESPEVDQQLLQAKAELATSQANAKNAATQAARYKDLLAQNAVSQQDTDNFVTQQIAGNTQVQSAQANVNRLQQMVGFERIYAPFNGVITARYIDNGQLINSGAASNEQLFQESQVSVLRVYVSVPQVDTRGIKRGMPAQLSLSEFPKQTFTGHVVRTSDSIDPATRTLLVEVDVDNPGDRLIPGSFGEVTFHLNDGVQTLLVPVPTLIFQSQGLQVATVINNKVKLVPITVGQNDGTVVEVVSGLSLDAEIIQNPPDSLVNGEQVRVVKPHQAASGGGK